MHIPIWNSKKKITYVELFSNQILFMWNFLLILVNVDLFIYYKKIHNFPYNFKYMAFNVYIYPNPFLNTNNVGAFTWRKNVLHVKLSVNINRCTSIKVLYCKNNIKNLPQDFKSVAYKICLSHSDFEEKKPTQKNHGIFAWLHNLLVNLPYYITRYTCVTLCFKNPQLFLITSV